MAGKRCADLPVSPQPRKKIVFFGMPCSWLALASLPDDLILEILSRLPAKSVVRFKCVCKGWLVMISSRRFADVHLEFSKSWPRMLILPGEYSPWKTAFWMRFYEYKGGLASERVHSEQFPTGIARWPLHCEGFTVYYW